MKILYKEEIAKCLQEDDLETLEAYLSASIKSKIEEGFKISPNLTFAIEIDYKACCAVGSFIYFESIQSYLKLKNFNIAEYMSNVFGPEHGDKIYSIMNGFDGRKDELFVNEQDEYCLLGAKLRKDYIKY